MSTMTVVFTNRVTVSTEILISRVGGESVLLNLNSEQYFGLDDVGTRMWEALTTSESIQAAYEILLNEYDVSAERLSRELIDLIEKLKEQGLIQVSNG